MLTTTRTHPAACISRENTHSISRSCFALLMPAQSCARMATVQALGMLGGHDKAVVTRSPSAQRRTWHPLPALQLCLHECRLDWHIVPASLQTRASAAGEAGRGKQALLSWRRRHGDNHTKGGRHGGVVRSSAVAECVPAWGNHCRGTGDRPARFVASSHSSQV